MGDESEAYCKDTGFKETLECVTSRSMGSASYSVSILCAWGTCMYGVIIASCMVLMDCVE